jgi:hypothetical protein
MLPASVGFAPAQVAVPKCAFANCYEPTIASDPQDRLFATDGTTSDVGVSTDGGATWTSRRPPPMPAGLTGSQSDVIVQVAPSGRLYYSALIVAQPAGQGFVLEGLQVAWSDDGAATWTGNVHLSPVTGVHAVFAPDRQWLGFGPGATMYATYNQIPSGIWLARSDDAGVTWSGWTRAAAFEARLGGIGQSGPPVIDADGRVFVAACAGPASTTTLVFRSEDKGKTFTGVDTKVACNWFPIPAVGPRGDIVVALSAGDVRVAYSSDHGKNFESSPWGVASNAAPWPLFLKDGSLALGWFKANGATSDLHLARGIVGSAPSGDVIVQAGIGAPGGRTTAMTDYASAALLSDGRIASVWVQKNQALVTVER